MYFLYSCLLSLAIVFYTPVYYLKNLYGQKKKLNVRRRFGWRIGGKRLPPPSIWFHAVSVGEVLCLRRLVELLKKDHPEWKIYCSTLTETGQRVALNKLKGADRIFYVPVDLAWVVKLFFKSLKPTLFAAVETEIWPHLLREAQRNTGGVLLINGRISTVSAKKYRKIRFFFRRVLGNVDRFLVQTETDSLRLVSVGVDEEKIQVVGNLKSDIILPRMEEDERQALREELSVSPSAKIYVAGSTHPGEDSRLIEVFNKAVSSNRNLGLILVPRHPQRAGVLEKTCRDLSLTCIRRSGGAVGQKWDVMILDTLGELSRFYDLCDCAFVGGSLVPKGGQNLLEPAFFAKPIFFGPYMDNFAELASRFVKNGAACCVESDEDLLRMFAADDWVSLEEMGNRARMELQSLQGATEKTIEAIEAFMDKASL